MRRRTAYPSLPGKMLNPPINRKAMVNPDAIDLRFPDEPDLLALGEISWKLEFRQAISGHLWQRWDHESFNPSVLFTTRFTLAIRGLGITRAHGHSEVSFSDELYCYRTQATVPDCNCTEEQELNYGDGKTISYLSDIYPMY